MNPRVAGNRLRHGIPVWSEDALTARARLVWNSVDPRPIARSFAAAAAGYAARLALWPGESGAGWAPAVPGTSPSPQHGREER
jgi:hypothetical protein